MIWRIVRPPQVATSAVSRLVPQCRAGRVPGASLTEIHRGAARLSFHRLAPAGVGTRMRTDTWNSYEFLG